jgi:hypothetical protein
MWLQGNRVVLTAAASLAPVSLGITQLIPRIFPKEYLAVQFFPAAVVQAYLD